MPVEMRLEDAKARPLAAAAAEAPAAAGDGRDAAGESAPALRDLIAARLVTHEVIGDPARLGPEPAALRALCGLVAGPVYRLEPFHYAFAARDGDLGGALAGRDPAERTAALAAALAAALGPEAVWLGAADLAPEPAAAAPDALPEAALLVLRAQDAAAAGGLALADPGLRAVIDAHLATEAARRAVDLVAALGLETAAAAAARDAAARERAALEAAALDRRLAALEGRLDTLLEAAAQAAPADATRAFEARLGLALAEFLARLERRAAAPAPVA